MTITLELPFEGELAEALKDFSEKHKVPLDVIVGDFLLDMLYGVAHTRNYAGRLAVVKKYAAGTISKDEAMRSLDAFDEQQLSDIVEAYGGKKAA